MNSQPEKDNCSKYKQESYYIVANSGFAVRCSYTVVKHSDRISTKITQLHIQRTKLGFGRNLYSSSVSFSSIKLTLCTKTFIDNRYRNWGKCIRALVHHLTKLDPSDSYGYPTVTITWSILKCVFRDLYQRPNKTWVISDRIPLVDTKIS